MLKELLKHQLAVRENLKKAFGGTLEDEIEKARPRVHRQVGDIHPNGKWVWTEYKPGKFEWRTIKKKKGEQEKPKEQPKKEEEEKKKTSQPEPPKKDEPKKEEPKQPEQPKGEEPKKEEPKGEEPKKRKRVPRSERKVGERHPDHPNWVWTEYKPGKFEWRTDPEMKYKRKKKDGEEPKKDEPKKEPEEPKKEEPKQDEPKKEEPKKEEPKKEPEQPKEEPKKEEPKEEPKEPEEPKKEEPKDEPKEEPKGEEPKEEPKKEEPKEEPKKEEPADYHKRISESFNELIQAYKGGTNTAIPYAKLATALKEAQWHELEVTMNAMKIRTGGAWDMAAKALREEMDARYKNQWENKNPAVTDWELIRRYNVVGRELDNVKDGEDNSGILYDLEKAAKDLPTRIVKSLIKDFKRKTATGQELTANEQAELETLEKVMKSRRKYALDYNKRNKAAKPEEPKKEAEAPEKKGGKEAADTKKNVPDDAPNEDEVWGSVKAIEKCKTAQQVLDFLTEKGVVLNGSNFKGMNAETARKVGSTVYNVFHKFKMKPILLRMGKTGDGMGKNCIADAIFGTRVRLKPKFFKNFDGEEDYKYSGFGIRERWKDRLDRYKAIQKEYMQKNNANESDPVVRSYQKDIDYYQKRLDKYACFHATYSPETACQDVVIHELGHILHAQISGHCNALQWAWRAGHDGMTTQRVIKCSRLNDEWDSLYRQYMKEGNSEGGTFFSKYSTTNSKELFAEAFTDYVHGGKNLKPYLKDYLDKYFKEAEPCFNEAFVKDGVVTDRTCR